MKKAKQYIETQIRDYISSNLDVIEPNLHLLEVEYYLKNSNASPGFIDILARDEFNQFVVIEIKRSNQASRSATNEILKYLSLLKRNFKINDSDVRFILISTVWDELLTPFSELYHQAKISIIGYKIYWENNCITDKKNVEPLKKPLQRVFSPVQMAYLFKEANDAFEDGIINLKKCLAKIGLEDYLILCLINDKSKNDKIIYPFALYFAFLRVPENEYFKILSKEQKFEILDYKAKHQDEVDFENQYFYYIENHVMSSVTTTCDTAEYGYPEKLDAIFAQGWKILSVYKNGVLKNDPRLNDLAIIGEIRGENGLNIGRYKNSTKKLHRSRFEEIKQQSKNCLENNKTWHDTVDKILQYVENKEGDQEITLNIYNPPSILSAIYQYSSKQNKNYLPSFIISIKDSKNNTLEFFTGKMSWNGETYELTSILDKLQDNNSFELILALSGNHLSDEILKAFGLRFETFYNKNNLNENLETLVNENRVSAEWNRNFYPITFNENGEFEILESNNYDFDYFMDKNIHIVRYLKQLINENALFV